MSAGAGNSSGSQPTFTYEKKSNEDIGIQGVFAFSYYSHLEGSIIDDENIYIKGITAYSKIIKKEDSIFAKWRILLYTDEYTYKRLKEAGFTKFHDDPDIDFVIVTWPYYQPRNDGMINGDVVRCMRFRAFFDFITIPVFVRDADTIWSNFGRLNIKDEFVYKWESSFLYGVEKYPNTFFFGTSIGYKQAWHKNSTLGAFAGFQSSMPIVPCFQDESLWVESMKYLQEKSMRIENPTDGSISYSNEGDKLKVGKDEQILIRIFVPKCMDNIFFYEVDYFSKRRSTFKNRDINSENYPEVVFSRGQNENLKGIFQANIAKAPQSTLNEIKSRIQKIGANITKKVNNEAADFVNEKYQLYLNENKSSLLDTAIPFLLRKLQNEELNTLHKKYNKLDEEIFILKRKLKKNILREENLSGRQTKKDEIQSLITQRDSIMNEILEKLVENKTNDDIRKIIQSFPPGESASLEKIFTRYKATRKVKGGKRRKTRKHTTRKKN